MKRIICLLAYVCLGISGLNATIFHVKENGGDALLGMSWENAFQTLETALLKAKIGDTICIAQGTYSSDVAYTVKKKVTIIGGFDMMENSYTPHNAAPTILTAPSDKPHRVLLIESTAPVVTLKNITICGGNAINEESNPGKGGGIYAASGVQLTLYDTHIIDNTAFTGGGIYLDGATAAALTINGFLQMSGNTADTDAIMFPSTGIKVLRFVDDAKGEVKANYSGDYVIKSNVTTFAFTIKIMDQQLQGITPMVKVGNVTLSPSSVGDGITYAYTLTGISGLTTEINYYLEYHELGNITYQNKARELVHIISETYVAKNSAGTFDFSLTVDSLYSNATLVVKIGTVTMNLVKKEGISGGILYTFNFSVPENVDSPAITVDLNYYEVRIPIDRSLFTLVEESNLFLTRGDTSILFVSIDPAQNRTTQFSVRLSDKYAGVGVKATISTGEQIQATNGGGNVRKVVISAGASQHITVNLSVDCYMLIFPKHDHVTINSIDDGSTIRDDIKDTVIIPKEVTALYLKVKIGEECSNIPFSAYTEDKEGNRIDLSTEMTDTDEYLIEVFLDAGTLDLWMYLQLDYYAVMLEYDATILGVIDGDIDIVGGEVILPLEESSVTFEVEVLDEAYLDYPLQVSVEGASVEYEESFGVYTVNVYDITADCTVKLTLQYCRVKVTADPQVQDLSFTDAIFSLTDDIALTFRLDPVGYSTAVPHVTINGKDVKATLNNGKYTVTPVIKENNMDVVIRLGYTVTLYPTQQVVFSPISGQYIINRGNPFQFTFKVADEVHNPQVSVTVGTNPDYSYTRLEDGRYSVIVGSVTSVLNITVKVSGSSAIDFPEKANVYVANHILFIETVGTTDVSVYDLTGKALFKQRVNGTASVALRAGFYLVKAGRETRKIVVK